MGDYRTARFHRFCDRLQDHKLTCSDMHRDEHQIVKVRKCALGVAQVFTREDIRCRLRFEFIAERHWNIRSR